MCDQQIPDHMVSADRAFVKALVYGFCRHYWSLKAISNELLSKPLRKKDQDIHIVLMLGIYQLKYLETPAHAAISESVDCCRELKKPWATKMINACLRRFDREQFEPNSDNLEADTNHPLWLVKALKKAYPAHSSKIIEANNTPAPLTLRVNRKQHDPEQYQELLLAEGLSAKRGEYGPEALILDRPVPVTALPGFAEGSASVQDEAAQICAHALRLLPNSRVLDACAAPGGKSCHMLELEPSIDLTCIDKDEKRCATIQENLSRLNLSARVIAEAAELTSNWWDKAYFDRILADVPCSSTGVIRRHPDIKMLREPEEVEALNRIQARLLDALWQTLAPGGLLLYSTCSILPEENEEQICRFISEHSDASALPIPALTISRQEFGYQVLPGESNMDGFYYCLLEKSTP